MKAPLGWMVGIAAVVATVPGCGGPPRAPAELLDVQRRQKAIETTLTEISGHLYAIYALKAKVEIVEAELGVVIADIASLHTEVSGITSEVGSIDEILAAVGSIDEIEHATRGIGSRLDEIGSTIPRRRDTESSLSSLESKVDALASDLGTLKSLCDDIESKVRRLER